MKWQPQPKPTNHKRSWSDDEVGKLREMAASHSIKEISEAVGRTQVSVMKMATTLGLSIASRRRPSSDAD